MLHRDLDLISFHRKDTAFIIAVSGGAGAAEDFAAVGLETGRQRIHLLPTAARTGYAHIAFSVGSREKVDALTARLKADGLEVLSGPRTTGDGYYESCVLAVEGNQVEITV